MGGLGGKGVEEGTVKNKMDYRLLVDTAVLAGEIMLISGAETHRVEDTVYRILRTSGFARCDVFVVTAGIIVTLADWRIDTISVTRRVAERTANLGNIAEVNEISRKYCNGKLTLKEAFHDLKHIQSVRYPVWLQYLCIVFSAASFTILLGGGWLESILAALNGMYIVLSKILGKRIKISDFVTNMALAFVIAFTSRAFQALLGPRIDLELLVAGSVMVLLPGVAITNAIRDTLHGDYMSGGAKMIEAFVIAASVGAGIGAGLALGNAVIGGTLL